MSAADIRPELTSIRSLAIEAWGRLTDAQRAALRRARLVDGELVVTSATHARVAAGLVARELAEDLDGRRVLTIEGRLVRREGVAAEQAAARKRYASRRGRSRC